jgi:hypothetical protein
MKKLFKTNSDKTLFNNRNLKIHKIEKRNENLYFNAFSRSNSVLFSNRNYNYNNNNFLLKSTNFSSNKKKITLENFFIKGKDRKDFLIEENKNEQKNKIKNILKSLNKWDVNEKNNILLNNNFKQNKFLKFFNEQNLNENDLKENKKNDDFIFKNEIINKIHKNYNLNNNIIYSNLLNDKLLKVIDEKNTENLSNQITIKQKKIEKLNIIEYKKIFKNIIINKIKKRKYGEILNDVYKYLDSVRTEYSLCVDILEERLKSVQKYYDVIIISYQKGNFLLDNLNEGENLETNNSHLSNEIHKKKNKKKSLINEEKIKKYKEYLSIVNDINNEINEYSTKFKNINYELSKIIKISNDKINKINNENIYLKLLNDKIKNEIKNYLLDLLKNGLDTRVEGLSWIIVILIEFNIEIDTSNFPDFLDQEQIIYLINYSKIKFEIIQLKKLLKLFNNRQNSIDVIKTSKSEKKYDKNNKLKELNYCDNKIKKLFNNNNKIQNLFLNSQKIFHVIFEKNIENNFIKNEVSKIKKNIIEYSINNDNNIFKIENKKKLIMKLKENEKEKKYYKEINFLTNRIQQLEEFINKMKNDEYNIYLNKFKYIKKDNINKNENNNNKIFNALFGMNYSLKNNKFKNIINK